MSKDPVDIEGAVAALKVLANPSRLRIALRLLDGERSVGELESNLGVRQPTLSQHLAELRDAGIVTTRRESRTVFYRLAEEMQTRLIAALLQGFGGAAPPSPSRNRVVVRHVRPAATFAVVGMSR